jgi:hypothetical protein
MSDALALAAVTATLRRLLRKKLPESIGGRVIDVTAANPAALATPDPTDDHLRLNLYLYQLLPNAAWRNQAPPSSRPGESAPAPLALDLYYLLTAYAAGEELAFESQQLLGMGMAVLHDNPILGADSVKLADTGPAEDLLGERVRITPQPLSVDDIAKVWAALQAPYVTSAAFEVSVVLIESGRVPKAAAPVLSRGGKGPGGDKDLGPGAQAGLALPYPTVTALELAVPDTPGRRPAGQPLFQAGEQLRVVGDRLLVPRGGARVLLRFGGRAPLTALVPPDPASTAQALKVALQAAAGAPPLRAGFYTLAVEADTGEALSPTRLSNEVPLLLVPAVTDVQPPGPVAATATVDVTCDPPVRTGQRVALLVGSAVLPPADFADGDTVLRFDLTPGGLASGQTYPLRLRVDGVDSLAASAADPFAFARTLEVA